MNHKEIVHWFLKEKLDTSDCVIDMTCGNGYDTLFLSNNVRKVIAVDIQEKAIKSTKKRCAKKDNIIYIHKDHSKLNISDTLDGAVYNLGYLPNSNKDLTTLTPSTINSLNYLIKKEIKYLSIATYPGHPEGKEEYDALIDYFNNHKIKFHKVIYKTKNSPVTFLVDFVSPSSSVIHVDELRGLPRKLALKEVQSNLQSI